MTESTDVAETENEAGAFDSLGRDDYLKESIINELNWDPRIDAAHVCVTSENGTVTLTGYVSAYPEIFQIREAVCRLRGVRAIADELQVRLRDADKRDDNTLAGNVAAILDSIATVEDSRLQASVSNGSVLLTGEVDWQYQRKHLEDQVAWLKGVRCVVNRVELRKRQLPDDLQDQIQAALARNAELAGTHINVTIEDDVLILSGQVTAFYERNLVEATAWQAPGVKRIIDRIQVI
ncbi:MAG: BON domain-containing protein [Granulosicoccus sp.]|nr:BON domain-containing protein [Granulosicoccus sp.]